MCKTSMFGFSAPSVSYTFVAASLDDTYAEEDGIAGMWTTQVEISTRIALGEHTDRKARVQLNAPLTLIS